MRLRCVDSSTGTGAGRLSNSSGRCRSTGRAVVVTGAVVTIGAIGAACGSTVDASPGWCEAVGELDATIGQIGRPDPESVRSAFGELDRVAEILGTRSPDEVDREGRLIEQAILDAAETGEPTVIEGAAADAMAKLHVVAAADCKYESVSITASDFAFSGLSDELPAGRLALTFENVSEVEDHELVLFRKADGVEDVMADLLQLPPEDAMAKAESIAFTSAGPGQKNGLILDLEPGNYGIVCFVPVGGIEDAAPHFVHGMIDDFVVR